MYFDMPWRLAYVYLHPPVFGEHQRPPGQAISRRLVSNFVSLGCGSASVLTRRKCRLSGCYRDPGVYALPDWASDIQDA